MLRTPLFAALVATAAAAQPLTIDGAQFVMPDGFKVEQRSGQVQGTFVDQQRGVFLQLVVYKAFPSAGSPQQDFASEWRQTVAREFQPEEMPAPARATTPAGPCLEGETLAASNVGRLYVHLYVFSPRGKAQSVMVTASNRQAFERLQPTLTAFFKSLRLSGAAEAATPPPPSAPPPPSRRGPALWTGAPIVGIWFGFENSSSLDYDPVNKGFAFSLSKLTPSWRTFLADGSSFEDLPHEGLWSLNVAAARADKGSGAFWGTWAVSGDLVTTTQVGGRVEHYHLDGDTLREDPKTGHTVYSRLKNVDGLRLEGTWSSWQGWDESKLAPNFKTAPVISFTRDGRFVDRGAFMDNPTEALTPASAPRHPGQGSYEILGYTLVLRYDDGRETRRAFTAPPKKDPARDAAVFFLGEFPFYRR